MVDELDHLVDEIASVHSKLIVLIGPPRTGKTALLRALAKRRNASLLGIGTSLGSRLSAIPQKQRHLQANGILRELADQHAKDDLLLIDNIELLFDRTLHLDPLDLLKRHAHAFRMVAVWPGELSNGRLCYAPLQHAEHREYATGGVTILDIQQN